MSNALRTVFKREIQPSEQADEALSTTPNTETEKSTPTEESKEGVLEPVDDTNKTPSKDEENKNTADAADAANVTTTNQTANELEKVDSPEQNSEVKKETEASNGETDDDSRYPSGTKLALLTSGLAMATFVIALDNTIIATAIPRITTDFDALNDVGWYGSSYLLTTTSLQPSFGKVYTYFDVKWVYLSALMIFELGSILCAAATGSTMLIVGRAVAGAGAAALFSGGMTIVGYSVPLRRRAIYIAALSSMFGIASVVGPILGGALTDKASWRWCFWINLPFGGIALATVFFYFSNPPRRHTDMTVKQKVRQIDILGAFFLISAIVSLLLALQWGGTVYPWSDSKVWGCLLSFGLLILVFCGIQVWLKDRATMPPRILCKQRTVGACALFSAFLAMALYTYVPGRHAHRYVMRS
jgi:MFS family permease